MPSSSSSSTTLNDPSSSCLLDDTIDENNDESFHSISHLHLKTSLPYPMLSLESIGQALKNMMGGKRK
ncbi:hypothetical protein Tco_0778936 [Tanacetum coccineum]